MTVYMINLLTCNRAVFRLLERATTVQDAVQAAEQDALKTTVAMINNLMVKQNLNAAEAMDILGIPPADQMKYTPWL